MAVLKDFKRFAKYFPAPIRRAWGLFIDTIGNLNVNFQEGNWLWVPTMGYTPGPGELAPDGGGAVIPDDVAAIYIHKLDTQGNDQSAMLDSFRAGDYIQIKSLSSGSYFNFGIVSDGYVNIVADVYEFEVTYVDKYLVGIQPDGPSEAIVGRIPYGVGVDEFTQLRDTPDDYAGQARKILGVNDANDALIYEDEPVTWLSTWLSQEYKRNDMVIDGAFTMIANKDTTERAAPQPIGDENWFHSDTPSWTYQAYTGAVGSGIRIVPSDSLFMISSYRFWIADISPNTTYRIVLRDNVIGGVQPGEIFTGDILTAPGWVEVTIPGRWVSPGDDLSLFLISNNSSATTDWDHPWQNDGTSQNTQPGAGDYNTRNQGTPVRFNKEDWDGTTQTTDLATVTPGTLIRCVNRANTNAWVEYSVSVATELADTFSFDVSLNDVGPGGTVPTGAICDCYFQVPVPASTSYVEIPNFWDSYPQISGDLKLGDTAEVATQDAYGIDITYQQYTTSEDWDLVAYSGDSIGSGGGGGTGFEFFIDLLDTPSTYVGTGGGVVRVKADETGLEFDTLPPSVLTWPYRFATGTAADPNSGRVKLNSADPATATNVYINEIDNDGIDRSLGILSLRVGDACALLDTNSDKSYSFYVTAKPTQLGDVITIPVTNVGVRGTFAGNEKLYFAIVLFGANEFTELTDTPDTYEGAAYQVPTVKSDETGLEFTDLIKQFIGLTDTPVAYADSAGMAATVNTAEDALEFTELLKLFTELDDTPADYTGAARFSATVNVAENALEFIRHCSGNETLGTSAVYPDTTLVTGFPVGLSLIRALSGSYGTTGGMVATFRGGNNDLGSFQIAVQQGSGVIQIRSWAGSWSIWKSIITGSFTGLTDTPNDYSGQQGKFAAVNAAQTAIEFVDSPVVTPPSPPATVEFLTQAITGITSANWRTVADITSGGPYVIERCYIPTSGATGNYGLRVTIDGTVVLNVTTGIPTDDNFPDLIGPFAYHYPTVFFAQTSFKVEIYRTSGVSGSMTCNWQSYSVA